MNPTPWPDPADLETYLRRVRDRQTTLDFSIFQEGHERDFSSVSLAEFYVPLRVSGQILSTQLLAPHLSRHLALLGDAGSGKTTILRHLTGSLAQAYLTQNRVLARQQTGWANRREEKEEKEETLPVPLFVPLRYFHHFCRAKPQPRAISWGSLLDFIPAYFHEHYGLDLDRGFYQTMLDSGRCVLILDGFDEVPEREARRQVIQVIGHLAADSRLGRNTILMSSRLAAYGGSSQLGGTFQSLWVQPLNPEERAAQIERWVDGISPHTQRTLKAEEILRRMPPDSPLDQLAVTPMIVTALCVIYFYDHKLPEQRAQLYRRCVDIMLYEKLRPDEPGQSLADLAGKPDFKRQLLARLAFELHRAKQEEVNREQAARWLKDGFRSVEEEARLPQANAFLDAIIARGTLLQERDRLFGFGRQHLTFREFLAGYHLVLGLRRGERTKLWPELLLDDRWREPIRLAAGATVLDNTLTCEDFLAELMKLAQVPDAGPAARLAGYRLAAEALWDVGRAGRALLDKALQEKVKVGLAACLTDPAIADPAADLLKARVSAGQTLGRLGDPREGVTTLPPLLTPVIQGKFEYGEKCEDRETAPFQAAIFPVTNAQFAQFMAAKGYETKSWWSEAGLAWLKTPPDYREKPVRAPEYWADERFNTPNQPVVGVSWYEAEAFCHWLTATNEAGRTYRLPTEMEWERLARGQHGRVFPWGMKWESGIANTEEVKIGQPSTVGLFPCGVSPTEAMDCAGNVFEWCQDWYDDDKDSKVWRGGAWGFDQDMAYCIYRYWNFLHRGFKYLGFRVVSPIIR